MIGHCGPQTVGILRNYRRLMSNGIVLSGFPNLGRERLRQEPYLVLAPTTTLSLNELKDLMIESESLRFRVSMGLLFWHNALSPAGKRDTRTHFSLGSNFLFYFIRFYESVSCFLFWSNWICFSYSILIELNRFQLLYSNQTELKFRQNSHFHWFVPWRRANILLS